MAIITVYTKLLDKSLEGARIIDMGSTKTCRCYVIPYEEIAKISKEYLKDKYAFYVLLGKTSGGRNQAYIGQTNDFSVRANDHKQKKHWWNLALVFVSKADEIFASEVLYLEYLGWKEASEANVYELDNTKDIKEPSLSEDKKNDMELFFEEIKFLTKFYGCSIFEKQETVLVDNAELLYLSVKKRGINAEVLYNIDLKSYTLLKGSLISVTETSCSKETKNIRKKLLQDAALCKIEGDVVRILQDCDISSESGSPSGVAGVITGTSMQGTTAFKNAEGKTFADLFK